VQTGSVAEAMGLVRRCWGGMLSLGATTFWEVFRPEWVDLMEPCDPPPDGVHGYTSLCHPWSAGVTRWLTDYVLGIRATAPGYSEFVFEPIASGLSKVSGSVATKNGPINAGFNCRAAWLEVPADCFGSVKTNTGFQKFGPGRHEFEFDSREPSPIVTTAPRPAYAAAWGPDTTLEAALACSTAWIAFAATPDGEDLHHLPPGTSLMISDKMPGGPLQRQHYGSNCGQGLSTTTETRRAPAQAFCGALRTNVATVFEQSFIIDLKRDEDKSYSLGILCRDVLGEGVVQTVDILDLETKKLLAPTRFVREFEDGVVLWLRLNRSVRIRFCHCYGRDVTVGGLLFIE
jgi:alpha-L-rhamnosidase